MLHIFHAVNPGALAPFQSGAINHEIAYGKTKFVEAYKPETNSHGHIVSI